MKVLLSIKPEFVEKIFTGEKKYEYRRSIFKQPDIESVIIYCTKPVGKVVGEITIDSIINLKIDDLWEKTKLNSGLSYDFYKEYFHDKEKGYAIKIGKLIPYEKPFLLSELGENLHPPQSFRYIK